MLLYKFSEAAKARFLAKILPPQPSSDVRKRMAVVCGDFCVIQNQRLDLAMPLNALTLQQKRCPCHARLTALNTPMFMNLDMIQKLWHNYNPSSLRGSCLQTKQATAVRPYSLLPSFAIGGRREVRSKKRWSLQVHRIR